jgi:hypothetical protein
MLSLHQQAECLIEPFHPTRYGGQYAAISRDRDGLHRTLKLLSNRWPGIKHVCETNGFPFSDSALNDQLLLTNDRKILYLERNNLVQRAVSNWISRQTRFWIGTRENFVSAFQRTKFPRIEASQILQQVLDDYAFGVRCRELLAGTPEVRYLRLSYEDLFASQDVPRQSLVKIFEFLELDTPQNTQFWQEVERLWNPSVWRYASRDLYHQIPGIEEINATVASDRYGHLFN